MSKTSEQNFESDVGFLKQVLESEIICGENDMFKFWNIEEVIHTFINLRQSRKSELSEHKAAFIYSADTTETISKAIQKLLEIDDYYSILGSHSSSAYPKKILELEKKFIACTKTRGA